MGHLPTSDVCRRKKNPFLTNPRKQLLVQTFGQQTSVLYTIAFVCATLTSEGKIASGQSFRATGTPQPQTLLRSRCRYRGGFMVRFRPLPVGEKGRKKNCRTVKFCRRSKHITDFGNRWSDTYTSLCSLR